MATDTLTPLNLVADLPQMPASDVKKRGWRGVMRTLTSQGPVLVTNHSEPEAVIVSVQEYVRLLTIVRETEAKTASGLETLRHRFDERLAALERADAGDRLRTIMKNPAKLRGKVKAGTGY